MTKTVVLERLGFHLARVLLLQAGNDPWNTDSWNSGLNGWKLSPEREDRQPSLKAEMGCEELRPLFLRLNDRNVD